MEDKYTIIRLERNTVADLKELGNKDDTYDIIIRRLIADYLLHSKKRK